LRRQNGTWPLWMVKQIQEGAKFETFVEAARANKNHWGASPDVLQIASGLAKASELPILEMGSGLSTVVLAASTQQPVFAVEHERRFAEDLQTMAKAAGVRNIALVTAEIKDGWYDLADDMGSLPEQFGLGFVDGPPREGGDRMRFFDVFGHRCKVILCDDANSPSYTLKLKAWAAANGRTFRADGRAAVII
jgi:hypothetical protein